MALSASSPKSSGAAEASSSSSSKKDDKDAGEDQGDQTPTNRQGEEQKSQPQPQQEGGERTLYDVLGAAPVATHRHLRQNYVKLARQTHPDATGNSGDSSEFSEIAEAWQVLGNSKDRLRYDRSLKAREFSDSVGDLLELSMTLGFRAAKAGGKQFSQTASDLDRKARDISQKVEKARQLSDLRTEGRSLRQRYV
jgi:curved DNA-binding protein CbpA